MDPTLSLPTLLLHIGDPKTGSSSIQRALFEKKWSSPSATLAYPEQLNEVPAAKSLYEGANPNRRDKLFTQAADWLNQQQADVAVLSAEHFAFVDPVTVVKAISRYFPDHSEDVRVIAYVRPHISRLLSSYAQRVKSRGLQQDFDSFCHAAINKRRFLFAPRFLAWRDTFGEAFTLRPFIRDSLFSGDVVSDFLHQALRTDDFSIESDTHVNASPTLDQLACLRLLQSVLRAEGIEKSQRAAVSGNLAKRFAIRKAGSRERLRVPKDLLNKLQQNYRQDAEDLDASFFDGSPICSALDAAGAQTADSPQTIVAEDRFSTDQVNRIRRSSEALASALALDDRQWQKQRRHIRRLVPGQDFDSDLAAKPPSSQGASVVDELLDELCATLK